MFNTYGDSAEIVHTVQKPPGGHHGSICQCVQGQGHHTG
jgi:hypothetical protein